MVRACLQIFEIETGKVLAKNHSEKRVELD